MVVKISPVGMIATTRMETTRPLAEFVACCGWPLLLDASPRRLQKKLALHAPECVLFWLDDWPGVDATAQLIAWLRQRGSRPYRVAVAHELDGDVEAIFRAAGAHGFLVMSGQSEAFIADALWPLLQDFQSLPAARSAERQRLARTPDRVASAQSIHDLVRPP